MNEHRIVIEKPEISLPLGEGRSLTARAKLSPVFYALLFFTYIFSALGLICFFVKI